MKISTTIIEQKRLELANHPLLTGQYIKTQTDLADFMELHVYAVWDFMSLAKGLQHCICPSTMVWLPTPSQRAGARFINEIILAEESDVDSRGGNAMSHFDLYIQAMVDVGADPGFILGFLEQVRENGIDWAIDNADIPGPCLRFMRHTFDTIQTGKAHVIAASFCFGRETVIPDMFTNLVKQLKLGTSDAPRFHYYLERHIAVDGGEHGPASIDLVSLLCDNDPVKLVEAEKAALAAIQARYEFWTAVKERITY